LIKLTLQLFLLNILASTHLLASSDFTVDINEWGMQGRAPHQNSEQRLERDQVINQSFEQLRRLSLRKRLYKAEIEKLTTSLVAVVPHASVLHPGFFSLAESFLKKFDIKEINGLLSEALLLKTIDLLKNRRFNLKVLDLRKTVTSQGRHQSLSIHDYFILPLASALLMNTNLSQRTLSRSVDVVERLNEHFDHLSHLDPKLPKALRKHSVNTDNLLASRIFTVLQDQKLISQVDMEYILDRIKQAYELQSGRNGHVNSILFRIMLDIAGKDPLVQEVKELLKDSTKFQKGSTTREIIILSSIALGDFSIEGAIILHKAIERKKLYNNLNHILQPAIDRVLLGLEEGNESILRVIKELRAQPFEVKDKVRYIEVLKMLSDKTQLKNLYMRKSTVDRYPPPSGIKLGQVNLCKRLFK